MKYWMITFQRDGNFRCETAVDNAKSPFQFIVCEWALGRKTHLVNALEITEEQYKSFNRTMLDFRPL